MFYIPLLYKDNATLVKLYFSKARPCVFSNENYYVIIFICKQLIVSKYRSLLLIATCHLYITTSIEYSWNFNP